MKTKIAFMSLLFCAAAQAQISGELFYLSQEEVQVGYVTGVRESSLHQGKSCTTGVKNGDIHKQVIQVIESNTEILKFTAFQIVDGVITMWWPCPKKGNI